MAGKNLVLPPGKMLFRKGDASNGMFVIRTGELEVFLERDGREVVLAKVGAGAMIGEMALFDAQPRSASVKAVAKTEVTYISNDDFAKLVRQIPKWFNSLMGTLSGRLRATNERLQEMEAKTAHGMRNIQLCLRVLHVVELLWHRDGAKEKDEKRWSINKQQVTNTLTTMFCEDPKFVTAIFTGLVNAEFIGISRDSYKNEIITLPSRANLTRFLHYFTEYAATSPDGALPPGAMEMLQCLDTYSQSAAYDVFSVDVDELRTIATKKGMTFVPDWPVDLGRLTTISDSFKVNIKTKPPSFKCNKKDLKHLIAHHKVIYAMLDALPR